MIVIRFNHLPTSANKRLTRSRHLTPEARAWREYASLEIANSYKGKPLEGVIEASIEVYGGKADCDNYAKLCIDSGNKALYRDDKQIKKLTIEMFESEDQFLVFRVWERGE